MKMSQENEIMSGEYGADSIKVLIASYDL